MEYASVPEPPGFGELSKEEQVRYLQTLWDRITDRPGEFPVRESHLNLADERLEAYRRNPGQARLAHEVLDRLSKRGR